MLSAHSNIISPIFFAYIVHVTVGFWPLRERDPEPFLRVNSEWYEPTTVTWLIPFPLSVSALEVGLQSILGAKALKNQKTQHFFSLCLTERDSELLPFPKYINQYF